MGRCLTPADLNLLDRYFLGEWLKMLGLLLAATMGLAFSANLFTLFLFYEALTISTYPLVTHKRDAAAVRGGAGAPGRGGTPCGHPTQRGRDRRPGRPVPADRGTARACRRARRSCPA